MNICQPRPLQDKNCAFNSSRNDKNFLPARSGRAADIITHAVKHGYNGLFDEVVPHLTRWPLTMVLENLLLGRTDKVTIASLL